MHHSINGFLKKRSEWSESVAAQLAEKDGLALTEKHWDIIQFLRTEFYANSGIVPPERVIKSRMEQKWNSSITHSELDALFPGGSARQGAKIAGCITMNTVSELLEIKGDTVWSVKADQAVIEALKLMSEKNIGALMVLDKDKLVGVVSERDFTRDVVERGRPSTETTVREIMSEDVAHVAPTETLDHCMAVMTDRGFRHLPVLDQGRLAGVLSMPDLVKVIVEQQQFTIAQLETTLNQ